MDQIGFRAYLEARKASEGEIARALAVAEKFESYAERAHGVPADRATADAARGFSSELVGSGDNTYDNYLALARFGRFVQNQAVFVAMLEILDGHEAFANLHRKVEEELGASARDRIFADVRDPGPWSLEPRTGSPDEGGCRPA